MSSIRSIFNASCSNCGLHKICFPTGLAHDDVQRLDSIVDRSPPLHKGEHLFRSGERFQALYAIKAGVIKVYTINDLGEELIYGFFLPGDVLGIDALSSQIHHFNAVAIDTASVCVLPFYKLESLALEIPALNHQMFSLMSKSLLDGHLQSSILSKKSAEQRLAHFICSLSLKHLSRGYLHTEFRFAGLHRDVALFLGLTPETVSRVLSKFARQKIMSWRRKEVKIFDLERLSLVAQDTLEAEKLSATSKTA